jgi:hypothetical protein
MTGSRPAGRPWTRAEETELRYLLSSGVKVGSIARKLKRSPGAIYARKYSFRKMLRDPVAEEPRSLPSERLAYAQAASNEGNEGKGKQRSH